VREISDPVDADTSRRVDARLDDLYQRHLDLDEREVTRYYRLGDGYYRPDRADGEQEVSGICLVGTDGEVHDAGDYEVPLPLHSIVKTSSA
jgi:glutaminase